MKKIVLSTLLYAFVFGEHFHWLGDYNTALAKAKKQNKPLMVLLIGNDSKDSKEMVRKLFTNQPYIKQLNQKVVGVIVNVDEKASYPNEMYWSNDYPTLFFTKSENETFLLSPLFKDTTPARLEEIIKHLP